MFICVAECYWKLPDRQSLHFTGFRPGKFCCIALTNRPAVKRRNPPQTDSAQCVCVCVCVCGETMVKYLNYETWMLKQGRPHHSTHISSSVSVWSVTFEPSYRRIKSHSGNSWLKRQNYFRLWWNATSHTRAHSLCGTGLVWLLWAALLMSYFTVKDKQMLWA